MNIGIVGLGLIGGSLAGAIRENTDHTILAFDISEDTMNGALQQGLTDATLNGENLPTCDVLFLSLYPQATVDFIKAHADEISETCVVIDCCGVKRFVWDAVQPIAHEKGFTFIGGHPMAGTQFWGFSHARATLFKGAAMILASDGTYDLKLLDTLGKLFMSIGFEKLTLTTPEEHDRVIAFTSQLAHVVSNAYVKSPSAKKQRGFSAGSYKDMTRVAKLNVPMWTELFLENSDYLADEIDTLIANLQEYSDAIRAGDAATLSALLEEGRTTKKQNG